MEERDWAPPEASSLVEPVVVPRPVHGLRAQDWAMLVTLTIIWVVTTLAFARLVFVVGTGMSEERVDDRFQTSTIQEELSPKRVDEFEDLMREAGVRQLVDMEMAADSVYGTAWDPAKPDTVMSFYLEPGLNESQHLPSVHIAGNVTVHEVMEVAQRGLGKARTQFPNAWVESVSFTWDPDATVTTVVTDGYRVGWVSMDLDGEVTEIEALS